MRVSPDTARRTHSGRPGKRDRPNSRGDATRELILNTAEQLFAERGIAAVPVREIVIAAGQRNSMAVQYHFGDKENLVREIAAHRARFVSEMRAELLADLVSGSKTPNVVDFVRSFVFPLATNLNTDNHYIPFLSRYMTERGGYAGLEASVPQDTSVALSKILQRLLPRHSEAVISERWQIAATSAVHTLARYQLELSSGTLPRPLDELLDDLVRFLAAGLEAPP